MNLLPLVKNKSGFTLVEVLIYIFIFIVVSGATLGLLFSMNELFVQYKLKQDLISSGTTAMERILLEIREADTITLAESTIASSAVGVITLENNSDTIKIQKNGNQLEIYKNDVFDGLLNKTTVNVTGATFYHYQLNGTDLIRVSLNLQASNGNQTEDWSITSGAIIRGSYAN